MGEFSDIWDSMDMMCGETQFNVSSLVPSLRKAYGGLWEMIELSFLGLPDMRVDLHRANTFNHIRNFGRMNTIANENENESSLWNFMTTGFSTTLTVGRLLLEPFMELSTSFICRNRKKKGFPIDDARNILRDHMNSMCAWKLASLLKENGVDCVECQLCHQIDVKGLKDQVWIAPCRCNILVHRQCLEDKLGLKQKLYGLEVLKQLVGKSGDPNFNIFARHHHDVAPQIWVSYDLTNANNFDRNIDVSNSRSPISVNQENQFISPRAICRNCGEKYERTVRLPRNVYEVVYSSLSDPLALARALSTFVQFLICIVIIAAVEYPRSYNYSDATGTVGLTSARTSFLECFGTCRGLALAWWQLQQSCMLHILFSPRFAAVVSQLWMHAVYKFYIKLYFYFVITSIVLAVCFIPPVGRYVTRSIGLRILSEGKIEQLQPLWDLIAASTLLHYAISSTTVIAIFWRTNYRIYTIANRTENDDEMMHRPRILTPRHHAGNLQNLNPRTILRMTNWNEHPIYHGRWR